MKLKNNKSTRLNADFVDEAIRELVLSGRVCEVSQEPLVVNPLSVSIQPCGKKRLILDLRHVNKCLVKQRVKYEDWKVALAYFAKDSYMFSFDLKAGITVLKFHRNTKLSWDFPGEHLVPEVKYSMSLPSFHFGLSTAPYLFTKLLKPLEKHWRLQGICIAIFLDDGWGTVQDREGCCITAQAVRKDLASAGFITNDEKSVWEPTQNLN